MMVNAWIIEPTRLGFPRMAFIGSGMAAAAAKALAGARRFGRGALFIDLRADNPVDDASYVPRDVLRASVDPPPWAWLLDTYNSEHEVLIYAHSLRRSWLGRFDVRGWSTAGAAVIN